MASKESNDFFGLLLKTHLVKIFIPNFEVEMNTFLSLRTLEASALVLYLSFHKQRTCSVYLSKVMPIVFDISSKKSICTNNTKKIMESFIFSVFFIIS